MAAHDLDNPLDVLNALEQRRCELRMPMGVLADRTGLGLRTVQRILSGEGQNATLSTVIRIAVALGITFKTKVDKTLRLRAAKIKARQLAALVQGTSALEDQAVTPAVIKRIENRIKQELLAGSPSKLWHE